MTGRTNRDHTNLDGMKESCGLIPWEAQKSRLAFSQEEKNEHPSANHETNVPYSWNGRAHGANALQLTIIPLNHYCQRFSATDTGGYQSSPRTADFQRMNEGGQDPRPCRSNRMA